MTNITYHWTSDSWIWYHIYKCPEFNYQNNMPAGHYTLNYTDASECKGFWELDLEEPAPLVIDSSTLSSYNGFYNVSCFGLSDGKITLNRIRGGHEGRGYSYNWKSLSGGNITDSTLRNQTGLAAGQYSVVVSDTFNCATGGTFDLVQPSEIQSLPELSTSIAGGYNLNCFGDNTGSIVLHPEGGDITTAPYQFQWEQGGTSSELHNLIAGDYAVTVTDGINCSITDTITIAQPDKLQVDSVKISDHNGFAVSCFEGNDGTIRIYGNGGEGSYNYDWAADNIDEILPI